MIISCIYQIYNLLNKKSYIGYTKNFKKRKKEHRVDLKRNKHYNDHLQKAWNKYGENNFIFKILEECEEIKLCEREHYWATLLKTHNRKFGYNISPTSNTPTYKMSQETKDKISISNKGKKYSKESIEKRKISRRNTALKNGYWLSKSSIEKIKKTLLKNKRIISEENKVKLRERMKGNKFRLGLKPSDIAKERSKAKIMKKIDIYDLKGIYLSTKESITEVAKFVGSDRSTISACLAGRQNQSKKYQFKYAEEEKQINDISLKKLFCKDILKNKIIEFENINIACELLRISKKKINNNLGGFSKITEKKYIFSYNKNNFKENNEIEIAELV